MNPTNFATVITDANRKNATLREVMGQSKTGGPLQCSCKSVTGKIKFYLWNLEIADRPCAWKNVKLKNPTRFIYQSVNYR